MQNLYKLLLPFLVILCGKLVAAPIDSLQASKVATNFIIRYTDKYEGLEFAYKDVRVDNTVMYYVFNLKNVEGYVIVVADDACLPILGYSTESKFDVKNLPIQLNEWLGYRAKEIAYIKEQGFEASEEIKQEWKNLIKPSSVATRTERTEGVSPLITTKWNQSPFYNDLCPYDVQKRNRAIAGCIATAMAQIMKYHNYPQKGQGIYSYVHKKYGRLSAAFVNTSYNWSNMPNRVTSRNTAIATLMYHCGISVNMDYGVDVSLAYFNMIAIAFKKYFGYASTVKLIERKNYSETSWINLLKSELDAKRPMQYNGQSTNEGHSFVCDGYDDNNFFHFNWGWGGSSDGFFSLNALNPGGGVQGYNDRQNVVIGIQPAPNSSTNLQLSKRISVNPNPVASGAGITVNFNVVNQGNTQFVGDYAVALFDKDFEFVSFISTPITNATINIGDTYTNDLSFTQKSVLLLEGDYYVAAYYREPQKEWQLLTQANFENPVKVAVANVVADLTMYGTPIKVNTEPIFQTQSFEVSFNIANFKNTTFEGDLSLALYDLEGKFVKEIETKTNVSLESNKTFPNPLVFKSNGLYVPLGTYILAPSYKRKSSDSSFVLAPYKDNNGVYPNLMRVIVAEPTWVADKFEVNDDESQAAVLPISFANNSANVNTEGSNIHIGTDIDHYQLNLPSGFNYEITARLHDSYNSGNGKTYLVNALFSYKIGTDNYSQTFDVSIGGNNSKVFVNNGGTIIFKVAPFVVSEKGSYLLDIQVSRKVIVPNITIISPKNGDRWQTTTTQEITWTDNIDENVKIDLLRSDNTVWQNIANSTPSNGQFSWTVPDIAEGNYKIGIRSISNSSVQTVSPLFTIFKMVTGIEDEIFSGQIKIYPNPTSETLLVQFPENTKIESIRLLNPLGQEILQTKQNLGETLNLNLSKYASGVYYLYVVSDKEVGIKKIVLNK